MTFLAVRKQEQLDDSHSPALIFSFQILLQNKFREGANNVIDISTVVLELAHTTSWEFFIKTLLIDGSN